MVVGPGKDSAMTAMINGIIEIPQREVIVMLEAGYLYMELGKFEEAEEVFQGTAALIPHSEVPHMALGHLYFSLGKFNEALKAHRKATQLNPESAAAFASVGEVLLFLKKPEKAMKELDKAIELDQDGSAKEFAAYLKEAHDLGVFG